jgi:calcineurin-like phosphoesterase family protein
MSEWFISDTHFGHANIIKYSNRPYLNVDDMNEKMIAAWNQLVKTKDSVYHMGDFAFLPLPKLKEVVRRLNGQKHLILGNHDKEIIKNQDSLIGSGLGGLFSSIQYYREINVSGKMICLFHYGQRVWNKSHRGSIMLYGHSHGSLPPHGLSVDVGVDCKEITEDYRPIHLDEVLKYMSNREKSLEDYHGKTG